MFKKLILPLIVTGFLVCGFARAGDVSIAERPLLPHFPTIQAAVDAALEGESLLVAPGAYASFTIDGKSVQVFVTGTGVNDFATITGLVTVKNLAATQYSVLSRLKLMGLWAPSGDQPAIDIANVTGHVRVQDSTIEGWPTYYASYGNPSLHTGTAVRVTSSINAVFSGCKLTGGNAGGYSYGGDRYTDGGAGLDSIHSSIAVYGCTIVGGAGSDESTPRGGNGGPGYHGVSYGLFASGTAFKGGQGGGGDYIGYNPSGVGGDALVIDAGQAHLLDNTCVGGTGGYPNNPPPGGTIVPLNGSIIDLLPGTKRMIAAKNITLDDIAVPITITGQPGDQVFLLIARKPAFAFKKPLNGTWMVPSPFLSTTTPTGTIGAGGTLVINCVFDIPDATMAAKLYWLQAICVDTSGQATLTGPAHVLSLE